MTRTTKQLLALFYAMAVLVQVFVISKVIPFAWVNGGRSESFREQAGSSVASIFLIALIGLLTWYLITQKNRKFGMAGLVIITIWWLGSLPLQLLGTSFEKLVLAPLHAFGIFAYVRAILTVKALK